ncbi:MAG: class II aldolase/adducin family protein [Halanaerobium sp.]|nr:class II aldolase/adducin family protein [Halanaerobium sp.]
MLYYKERQEVIEAGQKMLSSSLTVGTWGNISLRLSAGQMAITPSGMNYDRLKHGDIVIMDLAGNVADSSRKPSTEHPLHRMIYSAREDIKAIVHTHSVYATAMAVARIGIPGCVEDLVQIAGGDVRVADYALHGTEELGQNVIKAMEGRNCTLLANHGVVGAGRNLEEALRVCQVVEKAARIVVAAKSLGGVSSLSRKR